jgi:hypothetical protein
MYITFLCPYQHAGGIIKLPDAHTPAMLIFAAVEQPSVRMPHLVCAMPLTVTVCALAVLVAVLIPADPNAVRLTGFIIVFLDIFLLPGKIMDLLVEHRTVVDGDIFPYDPGPVISIPAHNPLLDLLPTGD